MMELQPQLKTLKKSGESCTVAYGKKQTAEGVITDFSNDRVWVKTRLGEYSIPLDTVRKITANA